MGFTVTQVGSWPRSEKLLASLRDRQEGRISREEFDRVADEEVRRTVQHQVDVGLDIVVDGEHRRDSFYSFVTEKLDGTKLMSLAEMLDTVEDKASFSHMLDTLDVPATAIKNPTCTGRIARRNPLAVNDLKFVRTLTDKPVKVTLPGPYLLTRSMWVAEYSKDAYPDKRDLGEDVVATLRAELLELAEAGCEFVQFDEPVLTEIVIQDKGAEGRSFM